MRVSARLVLVLFLVLASCNTVSEVNEPPGVGFEFTPKTPSAGTEVTFEARATDPDPDGKVVSYSWTFGDGGTAEGETSTHTFEEPGSYEVSVTVTDDRGATDSAQNTVEVQ